MKKYEVQYLDQAAPGATFMVFVRADNPHQAYLSIRNLGYQPIKVKESWGSF